MTGMASKDFKHDVRMSGLTWAVKNLWFKLEFVVSKYIPLIKCGIEFERARSRLKSTGQSKK
jgi:hypothetical protein